MTVRTVAAAVVGDQLEAREIVLRRADLIRYAGASGDFNVIHWDERAAQDVGLPDIIAHGMLTMGRVLQIVVDWVGDPGRIIEYGVRFTRPVVVDRLAGATLLVAGKVLSVDEPARQAVVEIAASVDGDAVLGRARATVQLD
jgi:acyl dehydratase